MWGLSTALSRATLLGAFASSPAPLATTAATTSTTAQRRSIATKTTALAATQYLLQYEYVADILDKRGPYREGHLSLAQQLIDDGMCLAGGPVGPPSMQVPTGALFLFASEAAAQQFAKDDPYMEAGLVTSHSIQEWNVVVEKK